MRPKIALVLSGGASLGFAHIGVLDVLLENGIEPDIIVGCSMGAIVGGAYAAGLTPKNMMKYVGKMSLLKFVDINFNNTGVFGGRRINRLLGHIYGEVEAKDAKCKFATIAVDIAKGKQIVLEEGKLVDIVRASMNIPGLLVPKDIDGQLLVDGGVMNNYPDDVAVELGADIVIGVDVLRNSYPVGKPKNMLMTVFNSMQILQLQLYKYKPSHTDVLLAPSLGEYTQDDFSKETSNRLIQIGRDITIDNLYQIKNVIKSWKKKHGR